MKYLLIILFISFQYLSFGQNSPLELTIQTNSDTIQYISIPNQSQSTPISNDSINHIDESNLKQGIWMGGSSYVGNCTNSSSSTYDYYTDNKLIMSYIITNDKNACYPSTTVFICRVYDHTGNILFEMNNILEGKHSEDYLWSCIYNTDKNVPYTNGYDFAKYFFEENISKKTKNRPKLTYKGKTIPGTYYKFKDGKPSKKSITRK